MLILEGTNSLAKRTYFLSGAHSNLLSATAVHNHGLRGSPDGTITGTEGLDLLNHVVRLGVSDLAEDDVLAIEPRGDSGGDEELGAVAEEKETM